MATGTEKLIKSGRVQRDTWLVSRINDLMKSPIGVDTVEDVEFLTALSMKIVKREEQRKSGGNVYSPSGLASCLRQVYLRAHWKELGYERVELPAIEPHFYFLTGDFIHLKWQFVLWKLSQVDPDFTLIDCEVPLMSKRGDHGGTIDVVALLEGELIPIDVKGLNIRGFQKVDMQEASLQYRIQIADYMMLWNSSVTHGTIRPHPNLTEQFGWLDYPKMHRGIILAENKGGPDPKHPAALTEQIVKLKENKADVQTRLEVLRGHEEAGTLPEIECVSTRGVQFQGCPFAGTCYKEIRKREKRDDAEGGNSREYRVAKPSRTRRSRRS